MSDNESEVLEESRRVVRVSSSGKRTRRIKCKKGFKLNSSGTGCVPQSGKEKATKRKSVRRAVRTKRQNPSGQRRGNRKRLKAMRKRKAQNVKNPS